MKRGFTLVELLVVVAIIALIVAIVLPAMSGARESSRKMVCMSNVRQLAIAVFHQVENSPGGVFHYRGPNSDDHNNYGEVAVSLLMYVGESLEVFDCPSNRGEIRTVKGEIPGHPGAYTEYEFNGFLGNHGHVRTRSINDIVSPSEAAFAYDYPFSPAVKSRPHDGLTVGFLDGHAAFLTDEKAGNLENPDETTFYHRGHSYWETP